VLILAAVLLAGLVIFVVQNFAVVEIRFLRWRFHVRLAWALLIAAGVSGFPAVVLGWLRCRRF
jgi:uncharacterized integral membrane protein